MVEKEIDHSDGTTTVFDHLDGGSWSIYTIKTSTGLELAGSSWAEFGANYTLAELMPGYERPDFRKVRRELFTTGCGSAAVSSLEKRCIRTPNDAQTSKGAESQF